MVIITKNRQNFFIIQFGCSVSLALYFYGRIVVSITSLGTWAIFVVYNKVKSLEEIKIDEFQVIISISDTLFFINVERGRVVGITYEVRTTEKEEEKFVKFYIRY